MKRTAVITRKPACPASTAAIAWASDAGTCWTTRIHATTAAVARRKQTLAVTTALWIRISGSCDQRISRYTNSPTIAA